MVILRRECQMPNQITLCFPSGTTHVGLCTLGAARRVVSSCVRRSKCWTSRYLEYTVYCTINTVVVTHAECATCNFGCRLCPMNHPVVCEVSCIILVNSSLSRRKTAYRYIAPSQHCCSHSRMRSRLSWSWLWSLTMTRFVVSMPALATYAGTK